VPGLFHATVVGRGIRDRRHLRLHLSLGIKYLVALATAHPTFGNAQLIRHHLEQGSARRTTRYKLGHGE
jgi:hypothetical protein